MFVSKPEIERKNQLFVVLEKQLGVGKGNSGRFSNSRLIRASLLGSRLDNAVTDGVKHKAGGLVYVQLLHEPRAMRFRRFHADTK